MINKIVIVGGGFAGWYTAAALRHHFANIKLVVIDTDLVPRLGVGETLGYSSPHDFKNLLGITDDRELMRSSGSIYKYGVTHTGIMSDSQVHQNSKLFNLKVKSLTNFYNEFSWPEFHEPWSKKPGDIGVLTAWISLNKYTRKNWEDFVAEVGEATHFVENPVAPYKDDAYALRSAEGWSYHVDAEQTVKFFKQLATKNNQNITHINRTVLDVTLSDQGIDGIILDSNQTISGDLYIDASGFSRVLLKKLPGAVWQDSGSEFNNSAWVCPSGYLDPEQEMKGATKLFGEDHGWRFRLNLYHRMGNGYIFNSNMTNPDIPLQKILAVTDGTRLADPKLIKWTPGQYQEHWVGNVIGMGISTNFVDPHDAPSFDIHSRALESLLSAFRKPNLTDARSYFNYMQQLTTEERHLRLIFNFGLSKRSGAYWDSRRDLVHKNDLYKELHNIVNETRTDIETKLKYFWQNMYIRMMVMADTDRTEFDFPTVSANDAEMAQAFFAYNRQRNKYISQQQWPNNYQWLRANRFDGKSSQEILNELHPHLCRT